MQGREPGFWASLFGGEPEYEHDTTVYDRSLQGGSTVVTVKASEQHLSQIMEILERHGPIDIDERTSSYGLSTAALAGAQLRPRRRRQASLLVVIPLWPRVARKLFLSPRSS